MDNVLVDFPTGIARITDSQRAEYDGRYDEVPRYLKLPNLADAGRKSKIFCA